MKTHNYYDNLSKVQKQKKAEKLGNLCYYEWVSVCLFVVPLTRKIHLTQLFLLC